MSNRRVRRDGQATAEDLQRRAEACPGHVASDADPKICAHCGTHIDDERPPDDGVDDLASILPPGGGGPAPIAEAVAERQAEAVAASAPPVGGGEGEKLKSDSYTYEEAKADMARLGELDTEQQKINRERSSIYSRMEKRGTNKSVFRSLVALGKKSAATIQAEEEERQKLFGWMIKPKLDGADTDAEA